MNFNLTNETDFLNNKIKEIQEYIIDLKKENNYSNKIFIKLCMNTYFAENKLSNKKLKIPSLEFSFKIIMRAHDGSKIYLPDVIVNSNEGSGEYTTMSFRHRLSHYKMLKYITETIQEYLNRRNFIVEIIDISEEDKKLVSYNNSLRVFSHSIIK